MSRLTKKEDVFMETLEKAKAEMKKQRLFLNVVYISMKMYKEYTKEQWVNCKKNYPNLTICVGKSPFEYKYVVNEKGELEKI